MYGGSPKAQRLRLAASDASSASSARKGDAPSPRLVVEPPPPPPRMAAVDDGVAELGVAAELAPQLGVALDEVGERDRELRPAEQRAAALDLDDGGADVDDGARAEVEARLRHDVDEAGRAPQRAAGEGRRRVVVELELEPRVDEVALVGVRVGGVPRVLRGGHVQYANPSCFDAGHDASTSAWKSQTSSETSSV